jgi:rRNA maturation RNase YbeY
MKSLENLEKSPNQIEILNKTKSKAPKVPFDVLRDDILGKKYNLSVAYVSPTEIKKVNNTYRQKNEATNVLSITLDKQNGEILLCPKIIERQLKDFGLNYQKLTVLLVIHAMLHLKGYVHSSKMDIIELRLRKKYLVNI